MLAFSADSRASTITMFMSTSAPGIPASVSTATNGLEDRPSLSHGRTSTMTDTEPT